MKEYWLEHGPVASEPLQADLLPLSIYRQTHAATVIACHDVFIHYQGGILLIRRKTAPAVNILWPIGGRISRGLTTEESIRQKVKEECNLELQEIRTLGFARTYFSTDPFGHGKGTDSLNVIMAGKGMGDLKLDQHHEKPEVITPEYYFSIRETLHPYVRDYMDMEFKTEPSV